MTKPNTDEASFLELLPLLCCPVCRGDLARSEGKLNCVKCQIDYEVTEDFIPILFPPDTNSEVRAANIEVYDSISLRYQETKLQLKTPTRWMTLFNAINSVFPLKDKFHLDFGCGPGALIHGVKSHNLKSVGLDVSINNLRNARRLTQAMVVCGDAAYMPFHDDTFDVVTETAVVHHVEEWERPIEEATRIAKDTSFLLFDSEPGPRMMAFGPISRFIYWLRKPAYKLLSLFSQSKGIHNQHGKLNDLAEVHNQPGSAGINDEKVTDILEDQEFSVECVYSPNGEFHSVVNKVSIKSAILNWCSFRSPWDPKNGTFSVYAARRIQCPKL